MYVFVRRSPSHSLLNMSDRQSSNTPKIQPSVSRVKVTNKSEPNTIEITENMIDATTRAKPKVKIFFFILNHLFLFQGLKFVVNKKARMMSPLTLVFFEKYQMSTFLEANI